MSASSIYNIPRILSSEGQKNPPEDGKLSNTAVQGDRPLRETGWGTNYAPTYRARKVTACARVQGSMGPKTTELMPLVMPVLTAQDTGAPK